MVTPRRLLDPSARLMNELVVAGAERDEILGSVATPSSDAVNMMNVQPALVRASVAVGVSEGAAPTVAGIDGVELARREGLALAGRRFSGPHARF